MTMRWSAVSAISLIRWLETNTVRPSAASARIRLRIHSDALGVEPVDRLVEQQHRRVAEQGGGDAEPLAHAEREARRRGGAATARGRPGRAPRRPGGAGIPLLWASASRWLYGAAAAGAPPWRSSSAPTSRSGRRQVAVGRPPTVTVAARRRSRPRIIRIVVDLPAPFGPEEPVTARPPRRSSARRRPSVEPYRLVRPRAWITRVLPDSRRGPVRAAPPGRRRGGGAGL